jgi:Leucine-rich repeat (LRR) protein
MLHDEVLMKIRWALEKKATELDFSDYGLETIPEEIGGLTQLRSLNLSVNRLRTLPESIGNLKQLRTLHLGRNQLERLPESLSKLPELG